MMKNKPQRMCMGCNSKKDKQELIRIVINKDGEITIDKTGKLSVSSSIYNTDLILQIRKNSLNKKIEFYLCNTDEVVIQGYADCRFEFNFILS